MESSLKRFKVRDITEEGACTWCGSPLYVGEHFWEDKKTEDIYCSRACAREWRMLQGLENPEYFELRSSPKRRASRPSEHRT